MPASEFALRSDDGAVLLARRWLPDGPPRAVVQIAHGLSEHSARYARLAQALNAAGYAVYANDHRGHGPKAPDKDRGHFGDRGGWRAVVDDLWQMNRVIAAEQPGLPIFLLGHSLGSFLAQSFLAQHSGALAGTVWSGSNGKPPPIAHAGRLIARFERLRLGRRAASPVIDALWFGAFNKPFAPARTAFDWLSRDPDEVDAYVADPHCGVPFTTQLAVDVLDALPAVADPRRLAGVRRDFPVYVFSGEHDPVGTNIGGLIDGLKAAGFTNVAVRIYEGARHETLNETNRDAVTADLIAWLDGVMADPKSRVTATRRTDPR